MVEIFLRVEGRYVRFLSVPLDDIQPLCIRPLKWLRFVAFAICGSRGHLYESTSVGTRPVDYESSVPVETSIYYYVPAGLNDCVTSSVHTQRRSNFRSQIMERDGPRCLFTLDEALSSQAVHILPRSKGSEYICRIIADRSELYDPSQRPDISDIDDIRNGIFLSNNLHSRFSSGSVAFMKTPNFALEPQDIPIVCPVKGPIPKHRLTLHNLKPGTVPDSLRGCELSSDRRPASASNSP